MVDEQTRKSVWQIAISVAAEGIISMLPMIGIELPPLVVIGLIVCFAVIILIGLWQIISASKRSNTTIKEQDERLNVLRQQLFKPHLLEIPITLSQMHERLQVIVDGKARSTVNPDALAGVIMDWIAKMSGKVWYKPRGKPNRFLWALQLSILLAQLRRKVFSRSEQMRIALSQLGGDMDENGIGLTHAQEGDQAYRELSTRLSDLRNRVGSIDLNRAIDAYLLYSYGLNSFLLCYLYSMHHGKEYRGWLPIRFRASETELRRAVSIRMNELHTEVCRCMEESLACGG